MGSERHFWTHAKVKTRIPRHKEKVDQRSAVDARARRGQGMTLGRPKKERVTPAQEAMGRGRQSGRKDENQKEPEGKETAHSAQKVRAGRRPQRKPYTAQRRMDPERREKR